MIKAGKFGVQEAICLTTITIGAKTFFTSPSAVLRVSGTSGWYMTLISAATCALCFTFIYLLLKRFPGNNIMEIYDTILGKFFGSIFSFTLAAWLFFMAAINLREFAEVLKIYIMPLSPMTYIIGIFMLGTVIGSYLGLEAIARFSKLIAYLLLAGFIAVLLLSIQNYNINRIFPIFGYGLGTTIYHGITRSSAYGEIIIVTIIACSLQGVDHIKRIGYTSIILSGFIISSGILAFTLTFPYTVGRELTAPMYTMSTLINYGRFVQRLESIFLFIWNISSFIGVTMLFYASLMIYCHIFKINDERPVILPMSIVFFALVMVPQGITDISYGFIQAAREWGWAFFYSPPIFSLIIAIIRKKKGHVKNA